MLPSKLNGNLQRFAASLCISYFTFFTLPLSFPLRFQWCMPLHLLHLLRISSDTAVETTMSSKEGPSGLLFRWSSIATEVAEE